MKTITIVPLLALLAMTGCGKHDTDNQSTPNIAPASSAPAGMGNTNAPAPPATMEPPPVPPEPAPAPAPQMTSPGGGTDPNLPMVTNDPSSTNPVPGS